MDTRINPPSTVTDSLMLRIAALLTRLDAQELREIEALVRARAMYHDASQPERTCERCWRPYHRAGAVLLAALRPGRRLRLKRPLRVVLWGEPHVIIVPIMRDVIAHFGQR